jgi:hypothetical protein
MTGTIFGGAYIGYERSQFAVISDDKEVYILETQSGTMNRVPKGYKPATIDNVSASFPQLSNLLSDYLGMYPILKKSNKFYFYDGKAFNEITKKYLKNLPYNQ